MTTATLAPPVVPGRRLRWTRDEYHRLADLGFFRGRRVERIRGEIVVMSPPGWPHTLAKTLVADALRAAFAGVAWVNEQSPVPVGDSDPEPDVAVIAGSPRDLTDHPRDALLVIEVADSSLDYDRTTKAELYAEAGIREYWIVDLDGRRLLVLRDPVPLPPGGHAYRTQQTLGPADAVSPLAAPGATIRVADLLP